MKREDFYFDSRDNKSRIHAVRWEPDVEKPVCILQIVHGMAEYVDRYADFAAFLVEKGFVVTAEDHLGHGATATDGNYGYFCKQDPATVVVRDVHRLKKITEEKYPGVPYFILGHSMGSFIFRNYLFRYGKGIDGAIIMGTGMPAKGLVIGMKVMAALGCIFGMSHKKANFINKSGFSSYLSRIENPRTPSDWLSKDETIVDKYIADDLCGFVFTFNGFKTLGELLWRLHKKTNLEKMPVGLRTLIVSGAQDPVGNWGEGPKQVYDSFLNEGMKHVELKLYEGDRHEILNELDRDKVYQDLYEWIMKNKDE